MLLPASAILQPNACLEELIQFNRIAETKLLRGSRQEAVAKYEEFSALFVFFEAVFDQGEDSGHTAFLVRPVDFDQDIRALYGGQHH